MVDEKLLHHTDWLTFVFITGIALIAFVHFVFYKRFMAFMRLPFNSSYLSDLGQEKDQPFWYKILLEGAMILGISSFIFLGITAHNEAVIQADDYVFFTKTLLIAFLFITLQRFFHSLTGVLFEMKKPFAQFMQIKDSYVQWASVFLLIIGIASVYSPLPRLYILIIGAILLSVSYFTGIIRASLIVGNKNLNGLQLFFYFCALEILPVFILLKMAL
jgi:hypothetical protein